ncbi:MAG: hypothetical protein DRQ45_00595 [Gammaproteobacteria bacterium]|nr:MAG: hypothetical protein DRQ45_00595 [Gammaproteobacteria bacterium]
MDSQGIEERVKQTLGTLRFIPFYNAISTGDYESIGVTEEEFWELSDEFSEKLKTKTDSINKQLEDIKKKISLLRASLILLTNGHDQEIIDVVISLDVEVEEDDLDRTLINIANQIDKLYKNYKILETQKPPTPKSSGEYSAYDILANMSMNLEFGVNFEKITVLEYLSYKSAIKSKLDSIKKK